MALAKNFQPLDFASTTKGERIVYIGKDDGSARQLKVETVAAKEALLEKQGKELVVFAQQPRPQSVIDQGSSVQVVLGKPGDIRGDLVQQPHRDLVEAPLIETYEKYVENSEVIGALLEKVQKGGTLTQEEQQQATAELAGKGLSIEEDDKSGATIDKALNVLLASQDFGQKVKAR